ncbi:Major Facilitator superfamily [Mactra antiquata]
MSTVDSKWSCVVLLAALIVHFISHGFIYSFGIYFIAIEDTYRGSKAQIAWIPSIVTGCLHLIGPFVSVLVNKLGCQIVGSLGGGLAFIGLFTSLFAPNIYVLYITMGIFTGFGIGLVFLPSVLSVTIYFKKYRGIACGLALSGCGIGNFVISPLSEYMLKEYGLKGTLLILSGLLLNCIPCCMMFRPLKEKEESKSSNKQQNEKDHTSLVHQSSQLGYACNKEEHFEALLHNNACEHEKGRSDGQEEMHELIQLKQNEDEKFELNEQQDSKNIVIEIKASGESTCNIKFSPTYSAMTRYLILIKTKTTMLFFASQFFFIAGVYVPFIFVPDKAKHHGKI